MDNLNKQNIQTKTRWYLCNNNEETLLHVLRDSIKLREVCGCKKISWSHVWFNMTNKRRGPKKCIKSCNSLVVQLELSAPIIPRTNVFPSKNNILASAKGSIWFYSTDVGHLTGVNDYSYTKEIIMPPVGKFKINFVGSVCKRIDLIMLGRWFMTLKSIFH